MPRWKGWLTSLENKGSMNYRTQLITPNPIWDCLCVSVLLRECGAWAPGLQTRSWCSVAVRVLTGGAVLACKAQRLMHHYSDLPSEAQSRLADFYPCTWGLSGQDGFPTAFGGVVLLGCAPLCWQPPLPKAQAAAEVNSSAGASATLGSSSPPGSRWEQGPRSLPGDVNSLRSASASSLHPHCGIFA